jgi:hypothetical protein
MDPLLVRLTVEPLSVELGARPAPVITAPLFTVALTLSENAWMRSVVSGFGVVALAVLVVAKVPLHVSVTGPLPLTAQSAKADELANDAEMKIADTAAERVRPLSLILLLTCHSPKFDALPPRMRFMRLCASAPCCPRRLCATSDYIFVIME